MNNNNPNKEKPEVPPQPNTPTIVPQSPPSIIPIPDKNMPEQSPPEIVPSYNPEIIPIKETSSI